MRKLKIHPYLLIVLTFLLVILTGTFLLMLPISSKSGNSFGFVDSFFMATSASCVTGLATINISECMTVFGKIVMCILMELGGLSFITVAVFFFTIFGGRMGISNRLLLRESLNQNSLKGIVGLVRNIVLISFSIQIVGICLNMISILKITDYDFWRALGLSTFHSISAFNNSGFDDFGTSSMIPYADNWVLNASTMFLIILGGLGFVVYVDIYQNKKFKKFNLHTKIVLITTLLLIVFGTVFYKLLVKDMSILQALFASVTARTAGFATYDYSNISGAGYILTLVLMFIGASPCSTGGGVKTITIAVVILAIISYSKGKKTTAFKRRISDNNVLKALLLCVVAFLIIIVGSILLSAFEPSIGIEKIVFEVTSAFSTTGLSMGITADLGEKSKIVLSVIMFLGRIGPLTVINIVNKHWLSSSKDEVDYIEEGVFIG